MPRLRCLPLLTVAALALPGTARAAPFAGDVIDGPNADIASAGDLDLARDGTGAVAYLKRVDGVAHVFVSRLVGGAFLPPERVDPALGGPADAPAVAASDGGRLVVAFTSGSQLETVVRLNLDTGFQPPQPIADGASNPSVDMSINGVAYVSFTAPGGSAADVRVARLPRDGASFQGLPDPLDIAPAANAGDGARRSKVAVSADGTAVVVWGEAGHVYARRVFGLRISASPQEVSVPTLDGHAGGTADLASVDIEDDSSYAWAVFRQQFDDGRAHLVARRLVGSAFEAPTQVDGFGFPGGADATDAAIELNGRGEGLAVTGSGGAVNGAILHEDVFNPGSALGAGTAESHPAAGVAENNDAFAAWMPGDGTAQLRSYDIDPAKHTAPAPNPPDTLTRPDFGPIVQAAGLDMAVNRVGDAAAVFVQGAADGRRLVAGGFDRPPGSFRTFTSSRYRPFPRPPLSWQSSFDLWGGVTYRVEIDGKAYGETRDTKLTPAEPVPDGAHNWRVVATDRRGQTQVTPTRVLRVDALLPVLTFKVSGTRKRGTPVKVTVTAADGSLEAPSGSGIQGVAVSFGDRSAAVPARVATHRYARGGKFTIKVTATDRAGNVAFVTQRITVKKR